MAQPVLVVAILEVFAGMGATGLGTGIGGDGSGLGHFQQVLQLQRFDARGVEGLALVGDLDVGDTLTQISQLSDTFLHVLAGAEHTEVVLHAALQLFAQGGDVFAIGTRVQAIQTCQGSVDVGLLDLDLPGLSGFVAEMTIFNGAFMNDDTFHRVVTIIACTSIVITAVYILRVIGRILYGTCRNEAHLKLTDATWDERLSVVCLVVAIAGMGLAPLWVSDMIRGSVSEIITHLMN